MWYKFIAHDPMCEVKNHRSTNLKFNTEIKGLASHTNVPFWAKTALRICNNERNFMLSTAVMLVSSIFIYKEVFDQPVVEDKQKIIEQAKKHQKQWEGKMFRDKYGRYIEPTYLSNESFAFFQNPLMQEYNINVTNEPTATNRMAALGVGLDGPIGEKDKIVAAYYKKLLELKGKPLQH